MLVYYVRSTDLRKQWLYHTIKRCAYVTQENQTINVIQFTRYYTTPGKREQYEHCAHEQQHEYCAHEQHYEQQYEYCAHEQQYEH